MPLFSIIIATAAPLITYLIVGTLKSSKSVTTEEYFISGQTVSAKDYANTSVAYALQMASIFLFVAWGIEFGLGALWTPLFWALGFLLLWWVLPKFEAFHSKPTTLHAFLRRRFQNSLILQRAAAFASIAGLWGAMMAEVDYTVQIYKPVLSAVSPTSSIELKSLALIAAFLIFGTWYTIANGFKAEVRTERVQLPVAYAAFFLVLLSLLPLLWSTGGLPAFAPVATLLAVSLGLIVFGKWQTSGWQTFSTIEFWIPALACAGLVVISARVFSLAAGSAPLLSIPLTGKLAAQGVVALISLLFANALWMIVDISTWQRVASVDPDNGRYPLRQLRKGTLRILFESPATWCLGIAFGWLISGTRLFSTQDPYSAIGEFASRLATGSIPGLHGTIAFLLYPLLIVASVSIMMSTVNALASTITFTAFADFGPSDRATEVKHIEGLAPLATAKKLTAIILAVGFSVYVLLRFTLGATLPTFLYGAYAMQLSLFTIAFLGLSNRHVQKQAAFWSLLTGFAATVLAVYISIHWPTNEEAQVLPPLYAVIGSAVGYLIGYRAKKVEIV